MSMNAIATLKVVIGTTTPTDVTDETHLNDVDQENNKVEANGHANGNGTLVANGNGAVPREETATPKDTTDVVIETTSQNEEDSKVISILKSFFLIVDGFRQTFNICITLSTCAKHCMV